MLPTRRGGHQYTSLEGGSAGIPSSPRDDDSQRKNRGISSRFGLPMGLAKSLGVPRVVSSSQRFSSQDVPKWVGNLVTFVMVLNVLAILAVAFLGKSILKADCGTVEMQEIASTIKEGADGFLKVQYYAVFISSLITSSISPELENYKLSLALFTSFSFLLGSFCSALAGYVGVWFSVRANVRVASAASRTLSLSTLTLTSNLFFLLAFRGGAVSVSLLYIAAYLNFSYFGGVDSKKIPLFIAGYSFGASFVGLFMQLGGGIYTKAADVGADLVGKIENRIPEDDPRNPAVIADLVGDNVGDCAGSMADVFESISGEIIGAMILGGELAAKSVIHGTDLVVSIVGIMCVNSTSRGSPLKIMQNAYIISIICAICTYAISCYALLSDPIAPSAWYNYFLCGLVGILSSFCLFLSTQYYTDYTHGPVQKIAAASTTGHGTNVISGISVGMESTFVPTIVLSISILVSYYLGLYGTACATMGTLCTAVFVLSMNNFGPIADNAGGIVEMSGQPETVRAITDELDAVGNITKAATKGYAVGGSALACFVLFRAFLDEMSEFIGRPFYDVNIGKIEVLVGGLLGIMSIFLFVGLSLDAVGQTAKKVVEEVRRQLDEMPGILQYEQKPNYQACVAIVTGEALKKMIKPACFALGGPICIGLLFRFIGEYTVLCGMMMFETLTGLMMAMFLDNSGGAWDNAKKYIEAGAHGGKGSNAHMASVTGDTVGDPFKDTAGPALHVIITTMTTTCLVLGPIFIGKNPNE
eukprot:GSMAST32.ASY1.ANO1.489.1 assembled CDS